MNGPMRRVALGLFVGFFLLALDITYWQAIAAERLRVHPHNPRVLIAQSGRQRGQIISSDTAVLATSVADPSDPRYYVRDYPYGSLYAHTVGFSSRLFGDSGVEASHASVLVSRQDLTVSGIINRLLGEDLRPRSLQLTLNHHLQQMAQRALGSRRGAIVALEPSSGRLLALVSSPTFNPNSLVGSGAAAEWETLRTDADRPLVNRATGTSLPEGSAPAAFLESRPPEGDAEPVAAFSLGLRAATAAGGGLLMRPHIVARVFDAASNLESETEPVALTGPVDVEEALGIQAGMDPLAIPTETLGRLSGLGETGSGYTRAGGQAVWFAGFVPTGQPAIVVAVVIESLDPSAEPGIGSADAVSIGRAVMREWLDMRGSG